MGLISRVSSRTYKLKKRVMLRQGFRQGMRFAAADMNHRHMNSMNFHQANQLPQFHAQPISSVAVSSPHSSLLQLVQNGVSLASLLEAIEGEDDDATSTSKERLK